MQQIKQTIWYIFTNSIVNLFSFAFLLLFFIPTIFFEFNTEKFSDAILYIQFIYTESLVFGIFISLGLELLSSTYIFVTNKKYKQTLLKAVELITMAYVLLILYISSSVNNYYIVSLGVILSFSTLLFASMALFIHLKFLKIVSFYSAILILFLLKNQTHIIVLTVIQTIAMLYIVYAVFYGSPQSHINTEETDNKTKKSNKSSWNLFDEIEILTTRSKNFKKGQFAYCVLSPFAILGIYGIFFISFALIVVLLKDNIPNLALFINYASSLIIIFLCLNAVSQLSQTTKLIQLYSNAQHKQLKNKILWSLDKSLLVNSFSFYVILFLSSKIFSFTLDYHYLLISSLSILLIALAYYPLLIALSAKKIVRVFPYLIYLILCSIFIFKLFMHDIDAIPTLQMIGFIVFCLILRIITQKILWEVPYESLISKS